MRRTEFPKVTFGNKALFKAKGKQPPKAINKSDYNIENGTCTSHKKRRLIQ